ncbi:MAG: NAD-glutamate dehydrogenase [Gammaproteobacteria bacterium]
MNQVLNIQEKRQSMLEAVEEELQHLQPNLVEKGLLVLARELLFTQSSRELEQQGIDNLCPLMLSAWRYFVHGLSGQPKLRVFNPDIEECGWQCPHTMVFVHVSDKRFLVDSVRLKLIREGYEVKTVYHTVLTTLRDENGELEHVEPVHQTLEGGRKESFQIWEISRLGDEAQREHLALGLSKIMLAIDIVVGDYTATLQALQSLQVYYRDLAQSGIKCANGNQSEFFLNDYDALIEWLTQEHFTFLGVLANIDANLDANQSANGAVDKDNNTLNIESVLPRLTSPMGLLRTDFDPDVLDDEHFRDRLLREGVVFTKSSTRSPLHRSSYLDVIAFPLLDQQGQLIGAVRVLGLFTAKVYNASCLEIPLVRNKVKRILLASGYSVEGHDYKSLLQTLEAYPRDELFQAAGHELLDTCLGIVQIQERAIIRFFIRRDPSARFASVMIFSPRDQFSTVLRERFERVLGRTIGASESSFTTYFSESRLAWVHLILRLTPSAPEYVDEVALEADLISVARDWGDAFFDCLSQKLGMDKAESLMQQYGRFIPESYKADFSPRLAVVDFHHIYELSEQRPVHISLRQEPSDDAYGFHIKVIYQNRNMALTDVMPMLENLGLRVISAAPYEIETQVGKTAIIDFSVLYVGPVAPDIDRIKQPVESTLLSVWWGVCDNDRFNRLVIAAGISWDQVVVLRAYARYLKQLRFALSPAYIARVLAKHPTLTQKLMDLFEARFHIDFSGDRDTTQCDIEEALRDALKNVESLDEDTVIRSYGQLIKATVRTSRYQKDEHGEPKAYVSLKLTPRELPFVPKPAPLWETFVYAPTVEGVHLRSGEIARGGIRWSDRLEDYRQEILGLMKAQCVKNCAIVPAGAKGGFILKSSVVGLDRDQLRETVVSAYRLYIRGLLDLIDNFVLNAVQPAANVIAYDGEDTYIVAAPDKGTATFSDLANQEAQAMGYWLGDAFASGGSNGYDHKVMGITARTGWIAVEHHLRAAGIHPESMDFTVVGIGDMGGDVFGNGMLLSERIKLVAAFNHKWIFIDPDPNPAASYAERKRLFYAENSDWTYYDEQCLSAGGGVYSRRLKSVNLSPQARQALGIEAEQLTPDALIHHLLQAPVDLLWSAGIGTYVKAEHETHEHVADKANNELRVNARQLRCKVVGEGGNLGMTQAARVEFAVKGGFVNTDFIDNVGGVACSDREVLLKILFDSLVRQGDLTEKQRNQVLLDLTPSVSESVMLSAQRQVMALSMVTRVATIKIEEHGRLIKVLEEEMSLDRALENLPDHAELNQRRANGQGLTQPELAVVLAYTKLHVKEQLLASRLPDDPYLDRELNVMFSDEVLERYKEPLSQHPLRRHMIATVIANSMVNMIGIQYLQSMRDSTGATVVDATKAFIAVREIFHVREMWTTLERRREALTMSLQVDTLNYLSRLLRRCARWLLRNRHCLKDAEHCERLFAPHLVDVLPILPDMLDEVQRNKLLSNQALYERAQIEPAMASLMASIPHLFYYLAVVDIAHTLGVTLSVATEAFFRVGESLKLNRMSERLVNLTVGSRWQALARESFVDDLERQQALLTSSVLRLMQKESLSIAEGIARWHESQDVMIHRWLKMVSQISAGDVGDYALYQVAIRELMDLAQSSERHAQVS